MELGNITKSLDFGVFVTIIALCTIAVTLEVTILQNSSIMELLSPLKCKDYSSDFGTLIGPIRYIIVTLTTFIEYNRSVLVLLNSGIVLKYNGCIK